MSDDRRDNREAGIDQPTMALISAYVDDRESLTGDEIERVQRLIDENDEARRAYREIQVITGELAHLGQLEAPRSYHLNAEMVGAPEPIALQSTAAWYERHAMTVRWATAAAAVLFVFVLGADLVLNGAFSDPEGVSTFETDQADLSSRNGDDDAGEDEAVEESDDDAAGDAADGDAPASALVPESGSDDDSADEEAGDSGEPETTVTDDFEAATGPDADDGDSAGGSSMMQDDVLAFDAGEDASGDGDRRLWRIAEFGLVLILGLLITTMIVLPRLSGDGRRPGERG